MPVRRNIVRRLVERVVGLHVWDGLRGEPVTIPRTEWDRAVDAADQLYDEMVRGIDWNRILVEAGGRHLQVHGHRADHPCGECVREALLYHEAGLGLSALHPWTERPTVPERETHPDWAAAFAELVRWRRPTPGDLPARPELVVLCGSTRFRAAFHEANRRLTLNGAVVLAPGVFGHADAFPPTLSQKTALDALHLRKIDLADRVVVVNPGGYIGESTRKEITYAEKAGKPVDYLYGNPEQAAAGEDFTTAGPPHPVAADRARAAAEQLPTVGRWPG